MAKKETGKKSKLSKIAAKGGKARAARLPEEERAAIAKKAAVARWGVRASHRGNFKAEFGFDVDCFVLDDERKTAVISQRGIGVALGFPAAGAGTRFRHFLSHPRMAPYVSTELRKKIANPLVFAGPPNSPPFKGHGYDVTILIDICNAILKADMDGNLAENFEDLAKQAHVIVNASAKVGITNLVYALAGYDITRQAVVEAFKTYVAEEARGYEKEFPDRLYEEWYRLYKIPRPEKNKPWKFMHLTREHVYVPLANSNGKILELTRAKRDESHERSKKLHQFLSEIGVKALRTHLGQLLGIARVSKTRAQYERHVKAIFGQQTELDLGDE